jgi:hypothetical protein
MGNFTIVNGQLYTPGLAIVDAPQPYTPLGGGTSIFLNVRIFANKLASKPSSRDRCLWEWGSFLATIHAIRGRTHPHS